MLFQEIYLQDTWVSQNFKNILVFATYIMWQNQFKPWLVHAMVDAKMVVGTLKRILLLKTG